jgi:hypothetical protein
MSLRTAGTAQRAFANRRTASLMKSRHGRLASATNMALMPLMNAGAVGRLILRSALLICCSALASRRMRSITAARTAGRKLGLKLGGDHPMRRNQLNGAVLGHLAIEPRDQFRRGHRVQLDTPCLQPFDPVGTVLLVVVVYISSDRTAALLAGFSFARLELLNAKTNLNRFPRLKSEIDDPDLTGSACRRCFLRCFVDQRACIVALAVGSGTRPTCLLHEHTAQIPFRSGQAMVG